MMAKNLSICLSVTLFDISSNQNQKLFGKKFACSAARAVFESPFFLQKLLIYEFMAPFTEGYEI